MDTEKTLQMSSRAKHRMSHSFEDHSSSTSKIWLCESRGCAGSQTSAVNNSCPAERWELGAPAVHPQPLVLPGKYDTWKYYICLDNKELPPKHKGTSPVKEDWWVPNFHAFRSKLDPEIKKHYFNPDFLGIEISQER